MPFERVYSDAPWENKVGYCRALRAGNQVYVTGTAPIDENGDVFAPGDPYGQAGRCLELIEKALRELGVKRKILCERVCLSPISTGGKSTVGPTGSSSAKTAPQPQ